MLIRDNKLYDITSERNTLRFLVANEKYLRDALLFGRLTEDHYSDLFNSDAFRAIVKFFNKNGCKPNRDDLVRIIPKIMTPHKKFKSRDGQLKIWNRKLTELFKGDQEELENRIRVDQITIDECRKARLLRATIVKAQKSFNLSDYDSAFELMYNANVKRQQSSVLISEGDIVDDVLQHKELMRQAQDGDLVPVGCGIRGASESYEGHDYKIVELDELVGGGFYKGDLTLIVGENNTGKSFFLMEVAYGAAKIYKKNVLFMTIEMNKIKQQRRLYSRITRIPYKLFRNALLTDRQLQRWERIMNVWNQNNGMIYVVSFSKGCTVSDVETKAIDIEQRLGVEFDMIVIDYLNDMRAVGKGHLTNKDWTAMGEISWDLAGLAKSWNNEEGIPIVTANQRDTKSAHKGIIKWTDTAFSKLPANHATVGIGISQTPDDEMMKRLLVNIWKQRDEEKGQSFYIYPDFAISKISSMKRLYDYYEFEQGEIEEVLL